MGYQLLKLELGNRLESVKSTNEWIQNPNIPFGSWVIAWEQTDGKGRAGNVWRTLGEDPLVFSGKVQIPAVEISLPLFSLFVGGAVLKTILSFFPERKEDCTIKWPNDIYRREKKVGGILIESEYLNGLFGITIGIGLNFYGTEIPKELESKATFLLDAPLGDSISERFTAELVERINFSLITLLDQGQILKELVWIESNSLLKDKVIETEWNEKMIRGRVLGIDEMGFLLIMTESGEKFELLDTSPKFRIV
ncbi:biotin--[acetyl-CoA-carboxylase] ligase [Leptospira sp. 96542]|nr:biotin--[acetyl-CoA-carboxylase] ligase [Leptospira sp. 96542]